MGVNDSLYPSKNAIKIEEGDIIAPFYFARKIKFNSDGSIGDFDSWEACSGLGSDFEVKGKLTVEAKVPEETGKRIALFNIRDTQGNTYYSNPIYLN